MTAGRARADVERVVGFFVNTLVLRAKLTGTDPVEQFLRRVAATGCG